MISVEQRFGYSRNLRARRRSISADARLHARRARSSLTRIIAALPGSALKPEHFGCWRCRMISDGRRPERFQAKACPGLDPGWIPVRVKKTRQNKARASVLIQSEPNRLESIATPCRGTQFRGCRGIAPAKRAVKIRQISEPAIERHGADLL